VRVADHDSERCARYAFALVQPRHAAARRPRESGQRHQGARPLDTRRGRGGRGPPGRQARARLRPRRCIRSSSERFDAILTPKYRGGFLSDLGAMLHGGWEMAASGNAHPGRVSTFAPIHDAAPQYAGRNAITSLATSGTLALRVEHLGEQAAARAVPEATRRAAQKMPPARANRGLSATPPCCVALAALEEGRG
jgi:hypothetical protein